MTQQEVDILYLAVVALPCAAAVWHDLKGMRIPNSISLVLLFAFLPLGALTLPMDAYLTRLGAMAVVFVIGFLLHMRGNIGGGDVKFFTVSVPYIAPMDWTFYIQLLAALGLAGLLTHRLVKRSDGLRALAPHWKSWQTATHFPLGLALATGLFFYLALKAYLS